MRNMAVLITAISLAISTNVLAADVESLAEPGKGPAATSNCLRDLGSFSKELGADGFGVLAPGGYGSSTPRGYYVYGVKGTPRQRIRALYEAAYVYATDGDEASCRQTLGKMREIYAGHQKLEGAEGDRPYVREAWRRAHLQRAKPVSEMDRLMRADILIGADIRNLKDEKLGDIEDVVLDPGRRGIAYVLVSSGGFMGLGGKLVAIRWQDLRATEDHEIFVLDVSKSSFENAPEIDKRNFERTAGETWRRDLDRFWDKTIKG